MSLESFNFIDSLNASNPTTTDNVSEGDDHIRGIKSTLKTTFPSINAAITATDEEINLLDGVTATTAELNTLDGITSTVAELNYVDGVTSNIQTQLGTKLPLAGGTMTGTIAGFTSTGIDDNATSTAITIDASDNVLVGTTDGVIWNEAATDTSKQGVVIEPKSIQIARFQDTPLLINRQGNDGTLQVFAQDGTTVGSIGTLNADPWMARANGCGVRFITANWLPTNNTGNDSDNTVDLGMSSVRFDDIYATNGTIQTSDRNEKQDIEELTEAEQRVAVACKGLMRKFRWKDAVAEKGDDARIHFGIIAQDLQDAFTAEGLDAGRYAMFISTTWYEKLVPVDAVIGVEAVEATYDDEGAELTPAVEAVEAKDAYTRTDTEEEPTDGYTERTRLGVRYPELLAFIISAM